MRKCKNKKKKKERILEFKMKRTMEVGKNA